MSVKLISITENCEKIMAYCARVSNPKNQENENISRLLTYCILKGHWSVFEQGSMTIEINTTRAISAQVLRHRSFSFQEFSLRYSKQTTYILPELRRQDNSNRQNSIDDIDKETQEKYEVLINKHFQDSISLYNDMLYDGIAKECARGVLPLNIGTRMYMTGNIRSWIHYIQIRAGEETQKEHRILAEGIKEIFIKELPILSKALNWT